MAESYTIHSNLHSYQVEGLRFKLKSEAHSCSTALHGRYREGRVGVFLCLLQVEIYYSILTQFHSHHDLKVHNITAFQVDTFLDTCGFQFGGILWPVIFQNIFWKQQKVVAKLVFCQVRIFLNLSFSIIIPSLNENYFNRHRHTYSHTCTHMTSPMESGTLLVFALIHGWCVQCTWSSQPTSAVF